MEPQLQHLIGEIFEERRTKTGDDARLDIVARGFWQAGQMTFLDVRVFNPTAKRYAQQESTKCYEINEKEKKKVYNERIIIVEHASFTPLVFSATGGMGRECRKFLSRRSEMVAEKRNVNYSIMATWIRRKISFSLIKSLGMCLRGSRSMFHSDCLESSISNDVIIS